MYTSGQLVLPRIAVKSRPGALFVREKEKVLDEKVIQRKVEEVPDSTGKPQLVTVEYVEKVIETEVWSMSFVSHIKNKKNFLVCLLYQHQVILLLLHAKHILLLFILFSCLTFFFCVCFPFITFLLFFIKMTKVFGHQSCPKAILRRSYVNFFWRLKSNNWLKTKEKYST